MFNQRVAVKVLNGKWVIAHQSFNADLGQWVSCNILGREYDSLARAMAKAERIAVELALDVPVIG